VFRLLKLAAYALIGYLIYEFYQGLNAPARSTANRSRGEIQPGDVDRSTRPGVGTMTGPGQGKRVQTEDASGTGGMHVVGRGVV
jgi:hypothetical protein